MVNPHIRNRPARGKLFAKGPQSGCMTEVKLLKFNTDHGTGRDYPMLPGGGGRID